MSGVRPASPRFLVNQEKGFVGWRETKALDPFEPQPPVPRIHHGTAPSDRANPLTTLVPMSPLDREHHETVCGHIQGRLTVTLCQTRPMVLLSSPHGQGART